MKRLVYFLPVLLLVWPPTVLVQEKVPPPAVRPRSESELVKETREFLAEDQAKTDAIAKAGCKNLPDLEEMSERIQKDHLTKQDKELIQDRDRLVETMIGLSLCEDKVPADERANVLSIEHNLLVIRTEYLEAHVRGLAAKYNDLVGNYNQLLANHNQLLDLAIAMVRNPGPATKPDSPWLKLIEAAQRGLQAAPIRGSVRCTGDTTAMGQGMTSIYVNCSQ